MAENPDQLFEAMLQEAEIPTTAAGMQSRWDAINVEEGSQITNNSAWSPFWRLTSAIVTAPAQWLVTLLIRHALPNVFLKFAAGTYLDVYAWGVNLSRKPAVPAAGSLLFRRASAEGTLAVPAGTVIESPAINGVTHRVATVHEAVFPDGELALEIEVKAEKAGAGANLGPGYYSILAEPMPGIVSVTNGEHWLDTPGADEEDDDALRLRCRNQFLAVGQYHHDAAYRAVVTAFSGIRPDYIFFEKDGPRGPGTANGYLMLSSGIPPADLVDSVNAHIRESGNHGHGDDLRFFAIPENPVSLVVTVYPLLDCDEYRRERVRQDVEDAVRCAFRENQDWGVSQVYPRSRFSLSQLDRELHELLADLRSVEFNRAEDIVSGLSLPVLASLSVRFGSEP